MKRCDWGDTTEKMISYHDNEWGVPTHDDKTLFEYLVLESMQCGLSWNLIIEKREIFRTCFDDFDYKKVAAYTEADVERILAYPGMIRSRRKIEATISNAKCFIDVINECGSFDAYLWGYSSRKTILYKGHEKGNMPAQNGLSAKISKDFKKRGFKYVGPTVIYSYLQACGMVNDHTEECFKYAQINENFDVIKLEPDNEI